MRFSKSFSMMRKWMQSLEQIEGKKAKIKYSADKLVVVGGTAGVFTVISAAKTIL